MGEQAITGLAKPMRSGPPHSHLDRALELYRAGHLAAAEEVTRTLVAQHPASPDALHLLGVLLHRQGRHEEALALVGRAIRHAPGEASCHNTLGEILRALGRMEESVAAYRKALALRSDYADALGNLGLALAAQGALDEAVQAFRGALAHGGDYGCRFHLANALKDLGELDEAIAEYARALASNPRFAPAHANMGAALRRRGRTAEAVAAYGRALASSPDEPWVHYNLGIALEEHGNRSEAIAAYRRALDLRPGFREASNNLGTALREEGLLGEAIAVYERALTPSPDAECLNNLGIALLEQGRFDEALSAFERSLALDAHLADAHSNLLFALHYVERFTDEEILAEHRRWDARHAAPLRSSALPRDDDPDPSRPLRVGYVSPDFRTHSVAFFIEPLLANHDRDAFEPYCYAHVHRPDRTTERLRGLGVHWRDIVRLDDDGAARQVRADGIDVLVDLAGHTAGNRLLVFARRPAAVQITYLGYPDTTGLESIGYRLTDRDADPPGKSDALHTEELVRLPRFLCYQPPGDAPPVNELPAQRSGRITFASFNNYAKINDSVAACWSSILRAVPGSRLLLKARALADADTRARATDLFARHGLDPGRLELLPPLPSSAGHLGVYGRADIALDPFPYNGTTTTCEALWMGLPVITLAGISHAGRVGVSILTAARLPELVAPSPRDYVDIAVRLAQDRTRLATLRGELHQRLARSELMDASAATRAVEAVYRGLWRRYCERVGGA